LGLLELVELFELRVHAQKIWDEQGAWAPCRSGVNNEVRRPKEIKLRKPLAAQLADPFEHLTEGAHGEG